MDAKYTDDEAARRHLEKVLWPAGPVCPRCGVINEATLMEGKSHRPGLYNCRPCDKPFTVTVGTIYEDSKIPLSKWLYATHLMTASKKGISAAQLQRMLGFGSYRTAWFLAHRIREAMTQKGMLPPLGGEGQIVEADETYYGRSNDAPRPRKHPRSSKGHRDLRPKRPIVALVERGGTARAFHVAEATKQTVQKIVRENVDRKTRLHTDESNLYPGLGGEFASHETVKHSAGEYVRDDIHTNSAEGFFGVFKKGMTGVYQHCGEQYLQRYVTEFEFRHNTRAKLGFDDKDRETLALAGAAGKRLTLRKPKNANV